jgi:predicted DNA-binding transcriptional regulator AlpA
MQSKAKLKLSPTSLKIEYWDIDEVVRFTGLAKKTIYNLCSKGDLNHFKQRKRLVFVPQEVRNFMEPKGE